MPRTRRLPKSVFCLWFLFILIGQAACRPADEQQPAENLVEPTAFHFATGDTDALRKALNRAIDTVRMSRADLRIQARKAAEQFLPEKMAELLLSEALRLSARHAN